MKNLMFAAIFVLAFVLGTNAQNRRFSVQNRVDRLKERLNLTDAQTAKVDSILTASMNSVRAIPDSVQDRRQAMRQIMVNANADIEKILTNDQKAEYKKMMEERGGRMRRHRSYNGN